MTRRKVYVAVNADHKADGSCCPKTIRFDNDRKYEIDKVLQVCRAASEVGGRGIRYTVRIVKCAIKLIASLTVPLEIRII